LGLTKIPKPEEIWPVAVQTFTQQAAETLSMNGDNKSAKITDVILSCVVLKERLTTQLNLVGVVPKESQLVGKTTMTTEDGNHNGTL